MKNANQNFGSHNGSENFYKHSISKIIYTDGVRELAIACEAYWLIELIVSHQLNEKVKSEPFQVWVLNRIAGDTFSIVCTNGNYKRLACQEIPFSDFPFDVATMWLVEGCLMLPSEY